MVKKALTGLLFVLFLLASAVLVNAFSVVYSGTCTPNATDLFVYNETGTLIFNEAHTGGVTGCWDIGFYTIEIDNTNISHDTNITFYLGAMRAGADKYNYTENSFKTLNLEDKDGPDIVLISPANNTATSNNTITFVYNVTDEAGIENCSILIDGSVNQTDTSIQKNADQNFTVTLADGSHKWQVMCYDNTTNYNPGYSEIRTINILEYGLLNCSLVNPTTDINVTRNRFFNFTVFAECIGGSCGNVNVSLDPALVETPKPWWQNIIGFFKNAITGLAAGNLVNTTVGATPFYTTNLNPASCSLDSGKNCTITWQVNATGTDGSTHEFYAF
ncbi:hypothetical protein KY312_01465, partial [Candidatus Woesearchaeota archaeon]|nr:hypothetical protein [Candidatus Woesearchaeota archaeon]